MLAAPCQGFNTANVEEYTTALLKWWKRSHPTIPTWAKAARIIFAMAPSSAASERVFSLVECMFFKDQLRLAAAGRSDAEVQQAPCRHVG